MASRLLTAVLLAAGCCSVAVGQYQYPPLCVVIGLLDNTRDISCLPGACPSSGYIPAAYGCYQGQSCCELIPECVGIDCSLRGSCGRGGICSCENGYNGTNCEIDVCAPGNNDCSANSSCNGVASPELYNCICEDGFSGSRCDMDACDPSSCANGGVCVREPMGAYSCNCTSPWFGQNCTQNVCDIEPCDNNGTCVALTTLDYRCDCALNYTGENCTQIVCIGDRSECSGNGNCVPLEDGSYRCQCDPGWFGDNCSLSQPLCGIETGISGRLINGDTDTEFANSWMAKINLEFFSCAGAIIANSWILTDAVCATYCVDYAQCTVTVGEYNLTAVDSYEETFNIEHITIHEDFVASNLSTLLVYFGTAIDDVLANNVALIKLNGSLTRGPGVNVVCPPQGFDATICSSTCKLAAIGITQPNALVLAQSYREVLEYKPVRDDFCRYYRNATANPTATRCGFIKKDSTGVCFADNGAALVCQEPTTGQWTLEGLAAFRPAQEYGAGYDFCSDQIFIYSDVEALWSWISPKITA